MLLARMGQASPGVPDRVLNLRVCGSAASQSRSCHHLSLSRTATILVGRSGWRLRPAQVRALPARWIGDSSRPNRHQNSHHPSSLLFLPPSSVILSVRPLVVLGPCLSWWALSSPRGCAFRWAPSGARNKFHRPSLPFRLRFASGAVRRCVLCS